MPVFPLHGFDHCFHPARLIWLDLHFHSALSATGAANVTDCQCVSSYVVSWVYHNMIRDVKPLSVKQWMWLHERMKEGPTEE